MSGAGVEAAVSKAALPIAEAKRELPGGGHALLAKLGRVPTPRGMPIYEYYCPDNHTIYQFYAKTLAQGQTIPKCPDGPGLRMRKLVSAFAITSGGAKDDATAPKPEAGTGGDPAEDARMEAAMGAMESEFAHIDENDPKAMARMMRRMSELTGEKIDGEMEEVVRKLEEGADPDSLEDQLGAGEDAGGAGDPYGEGMGMGPEAGVAADPKEPRHRFKVRRALPRRDPKLYDYCPETKVDSMS